MEYGLVRTIWGIHTEWDDATGPNDTKDIAIGWAELGDLTALPSSRDAFKAAFTEIYPTAKPGAVPVQAGAPTTKPSGYFPKPRLNERIARRGPLFVVQRSLLKQKKTPLFGRKSCLLSSCQFPVPETPRRARIRQPRPAAELANGGRRFSRMSDPAP
jgi:hypothetical protein